MPFKTGAGIGFAPWRDIGMTDRGLDRIAPRQCGNEGRQAMVLGLLEGLVVTPFELDADGKIIAARTTLPEGNARMPGTIETGDELNKRAVAPNQKMRGHMQIAQRCKIRMSLVVERIQE